MIDISDKSYFKYLLFSSLYFTEGIIKVFAAVILPVYFLEKGVSPGLVTLVISITAIPMVIKFIWGGITDFYISKGRKPFIILGGMISVISLFVLSFIDPGVALIPFSVFLFISWSGVGFLDVSSDALAIEISEEKERGKINGAMYGGLNCGMILGSIFLPFIANNYGYSATFITAGIMILLIIIFPLSIKEVKKTKSRKKALPILINEFKKKTTIMITIFACLIAMNSGMLLFFVPLFLDLNLGLNLGQIGFIMAVFTVSVTIGSIAGGFFADRFGRKNILYVLIISSIISTGSLIFTSDFQSFTVIYSIIGFLQGGYYVSYMAICMDITNPKVGATQFSILMGMGNLGILFAGSISGSLYVIFGFMKLFLFSAWVFGPPLLLLYFIRFKLYLNPKEEKTISVENS